MNTLKGRHSYTIVAPFFAVGTVCIEQRTACLCLGFLSPEFDGVDRYHASMNEDLYMPFVHIA